MKKHRTKPKHPSDEEAYHWLLSVEGLTKSQLARIVGVRKQAVTRWTAVPLKYVRVIHETTGIPKKRLRPSDFS
jgi:hypothetical protein